MYDIHLVHSTAPCRMVEDRLKEAERLREIHRAEQQHKAWVRVRRAVELGLREGLDARELSHELVARLSHGARN